MELKLFFGLSRLNRTRYILFSTLAGLLPCIFIGLYYLTLLGIINFALIGLFVFMIAAFVFSVIGLVLSFKFTVQRYRDINSKFWWALTFFSPAFFIVFLILSYEKGDELSNRYGEPNSPTSKVFSVLAGMIYLSGLLLSIMFLVSVFF